MLTLDSGLTWRSLAKKKDKGIEGKASWLCLISKDEKERFKRRKISGVLWEIAVKNMSAGPQTEAKIGTGRTVGVITFPYQVCA